MHVAVLAREARLLDLLWRLVRDEHALEVALGCRRVLGRVEPCHEIPRERPLGVARRAARAARALRAFGARRRGAVPVRRVATEAGSLSPGAEPCAAGPRIVAEQPPVSANNPLPT